MWTDKPNCRMVVWGMRWHCVLPLCFLMAGHWALLIQSWFCTIPLSIHAYRSTDTFLTGATWLPGMGCFTLHTTAVGLSVTFIYSICFDFIVLCLCTFKLLGGTQGYRRSRLVNLVFQDGLIYFIAAFVLSLCTLS